MPCAGITFTQQPCRLAWVSFSGVPLPEVSSSTAGLPSRKKRQLSDAEIVPQPERDFR